MNIAFVGNFERHKGSEIFKKTVKQLKNNHKWYVLGVIKDPGFMLQGIEKYLSAAHRFQFGKLGDMLRKYEIDLVLLFNMLPESFSLTFFETIDAEIPFIAFKVGFPPTAFKDYPYFIDLKDTDKISEIIGKLDEEKLKKAKEMIIKYKLENFEAMVKKIEKKYEVVDRVLS